MTTDRLVGGVFVLIASFAFWHAYTLVVPFAAGGNADINGRVVADVLHKSVDTAIQLNGARGYSKDTVLEWIYRYARQARLVDGASEVHRMVLARHYMSERGGFWSWD